VCAFLYRAKYGDARVPEYGPLARFLELPELHLPLTARRVGGIASDVFRSFARTDQPTRYPGAFFVYGRIAPTLRRQRAVRAHTRFARTGKVARKV